MVASVATAGRAQRRYGAPPETGTLTTGAPSAWATSTAYAVDPTAGGINLVTNAGNLYQCRTNHTSSGANEPTTTSDTTQWKYLGAAPAANDTVSGSQIVAFHAGATTLSTPTDNDSGSFTLVDSHGYASFGNWGIGVWRRSTAANTKTGYTTSATWTGTSPGSGAGEEVTLGWAELRNVIVGAPHTNVHVERSSPSGGTVTGASYTLTTRCLVLSVWGGIGGVVTAGTSHTATPTGGITSIGTLNMTMSLTEDGYIQLHVGYAIRDPGTYADVWTTTEGAQLFTVAWPVSELEGAASVTLGAATLSAAGTVPIVGSADVTLGAATLSAAGSSPISGAAAVTLDDATAAGAGTVAIVGAGAATLGEATAAAAGVVPVVGAGSVTLGDATSSAAGAVAVQGAAAVTLDAATVSAAGGVTLIGSADVALGEAAAAGAGAVAVQGAAAPELGGATVSGAGTVSGPGPIAGDLAATLGAATLSAAGTVPITGAATIALGAATLASSSGAITGAAAVTLGAATAAAAGGDPHRLVENAIFSWVLAGSGLADGQVMWGRVSAKNGPQPSGTFISMRITGSRRVSNDWVLSREVSGTIEHRIEGTRQPTLEISCFAGEPFGADTAANILDRVLASIKLPSVAAALRAAGVGIGARGRIRVVDETRSGMLDPMALVEVGLHLGFAMVDPAAGSAIERVEATPPGGAARWVPEPPA